MSKTRHSRGYFIAGIIFVMLLVALVVKGDLLIKHFLSQSNALPVKALEFLFPVHASCLSVNTEDQRAMPMNGKQR